MQIFQDFLIIFFNTILIIQYNYFKTTCSESRDQSQKEIREAKKKEKRLKRQMSRKSNLLKKKKKYSKNENTIPIQLKNSQGQIDPLVPLVVKNESILFSSYKDPNALELPGFKIF